jgi:hypothetical protein
LTLNFRSIQSNLGAFELPVWLAAAAKIQRTEAASLSTEALMSALTDAPRMETCAAEALTQNQVFQGEMDWIIFFGLTWAKATVTEWAPAWRGTAMSW